MGVEQVTLKKSDRQIMHIIQKPAGAILALSTKVKGVPGRSVMEGAWGKQWPLPQGQTAQPSKGVTMKRQYHS